MAKSEMDILKLDERQRLFWLLANRATLMIVGLAWLGMIAWDIIHQGRPYFLIVMVPVIALIRYLFYLYYTRRS